MNEIKREPVLGLAALLAYGLVFIIPISPISIYGFVNSDSHGMVPLVYLIGAVAMLFTALSYRKMSQLYPAGGSVFTYVSASLGNRWGFITGWIILMDYILIPALVYRLSGTWIQDIFPLIPAWLWIVTIALFNTAISCRGIILTTKMSFILLSAQLISIIAFSLCAYFYISNQSEVISYTSSLYNAEHFNITFIGTALSLALLNYLGFDGISTLAEETKNPKKNIGNAIVISLILVALIFVAQTYIASLAGQHLKLSKETAFFDIAYAVGGPLLYSSLMAINIISVGIASALVTQAASSRILNVMARHHVLPGSKYLSPINARFQTPIIATCLSGLLAIIFSLSLGQEALIALVSWGGLTAYLILNYSIIHRCFFKRELNEKKAWISTLLLPLLGIFLIAFVWLHFTASTFIISGCFVLCGIFLYWKQTKTSSVTTLLFDSNSR